MGKKANQTREETERKIRMTPLTVEEKRLFRTVRYEGSPFHKRNPGDFGLTPPSAPREDATLCDEANIFSKRDSMRLIWKGLRRGLVSEHIMNTGFPKQFWIVDKMGRVFEAMYGGSSTGIYHGYPIRESDPFSQIVKEAW